MTDRLRETDALVEENNAIAHELEVYGAEDEPRVNVHKHLFRLAAALLRRNATTIERQGNALRAVEKELDSMDEMAKMSVPPEYHNVASWLRAALAQTEPPTDAGEPYVSLAGTALQRFKENPLRDDSK